MDTSGHNPLLKPYISKNDKISGWYVQVLLKYLGRPKSSYYKIITHLTFSTIESIRRSIRSRLFIPQKCIFNFVFFWNTFQQPRISATDTPQCQQCNYNQWNIQIGQPCGDEITLDDAKIQGQSCQGANERNSEKETKGPTGSHDETGISIGTCAEEKHATDASCTATEDAV